MSTVPPPYKVIALKVPTDTYKKIKEAAMREDRLPGNWIRWLVKRELGETSETS